MWIWIVFLLAGTIAGATAAFVFFALGAIRRYDAQVNSLLPYGSDQRSVFVENAEPLSKEDFATLADELNLHPQALKSLLDAVQQADMADALRDETLLHHSYVFNAERQLGLKLTVDQSEARDKAVAALEHGDFDTAAALARTLAEEQAEAAKALEDTREARRRERRKDMLGESEGKVQDALHRLDEHIERERREHLAKQATLLGFYAKMRTFQLRYAQAEAPLAQALALDEAAYADRPDAVTLTLESVLENLIKQAKCEQAKDVLLGFMQRHSANLDEDRFRVVTHFNAVAECYLAQGAVEQAEALLLRCLDIEREVDEPNRGGGLITSLEQLVDFYWGRERLDEAAGYLQQALDIALELWGEETYGYAGLLETQGKLLEAQGREEKAQARFAKVHALRAKLN